MNSNAAVTTERLDMTLDDLIKARKEEGKQAKQRLPVKKINKATGRASLHANDAARKSLRLNAVKQARGTSTKPIRRRPIFAKRAKGIVKKALQRASIRHAPSRRHSIQHSSNTAKPHRPPAQRLKITVTNSNVQTSKITTNVPTSALKRPRKQMINATDISAMRGQNSQRAYLKHTSMSSRQNKSRTVKHIIAGKRARAERIVLLRGAMGATQPRTLNERFTQGVGRGSRLMASTRRAQRATNVRRATQAVGGGHARRRISSHRTVTARGVHFLSR
jgi:hypothetical protein